MEADSEVACIARLGRPGKYCYQVIAGREDVPVCYVNSCNEASYLNWLQERLQTAGYRLQEDDEEPDQSLKSNLRSFAVDASQSNQMLSLVTSTEPAQSDVYFNTTDIGRLGIVVGTIGIIFMTHEAADQGKQELSDALNRLSEISKKHNYAALLKLSIEKGIIKKDPIFESNISSIQKAYLELYSKQLSIVNVLKASGQPSEEQLQDVMMAEAEVAELEAETKFSLLLQKYECFK